jgi:hypothetical protein
MKNNSAYLINGKTTIKKSLELLNSKIVAVPTYTCKRVLDAILESNCTPVIIDCNKDLQLNLDDLIVQSKYYLIDTVIVPHMFGIQVDIKPIRDWGNHLNIIEDCSQCMGLDNLGKYSDIVMASLGPTKWMPVGTNKENGGGVLAYDGEDIEWHDNATAIHRSNVMFQDIDKMFTKRNDRVNELKKLNGIPFIGQEKPNAWLRAMYITKNQKRQPYTPLHDLHGGFTCPIIDSMKNNLDWVSIFPN